MLKKKKIPQTNYDKRLREERRNKLKPYESDRKKVCKECKSSKHVTEFSIDMAYSDGLSNKCKLCLNKLSKEYRRLNVEQALWSSRKYWANKNGVKFDLKISDIVIPEFCPVLGIKLETGDHKSVESSPTLDRKIPSLGYVKNNIAVISHKANRMKSDMTISDVEMLLKYMKGN